MIADMYAIHRDQISRLAGEWIEKGALSFSLYGDDDIVDQWCMEDQPTPAARMNDREIVGHITISGQIAGRLSVVGAPETMQPALNDDAAVLSQLFTLEYEMDTMTTELIQNQDQLLAMYDIVRATRSAVTLPAIMSSVLENVAQLVPSETVFIWLQLPERPLLLTQVPDAAYSPAVLENLFARVVESGRSLLENGAVEHEPLPPGVNNTMSIPIGLDNAIIGILGLVNKRTGLFSTPERKLIEAIAQQTEAKIENTLLHEENIRQAKLQTEMDLARSVQLQLLPQNPPVVPGLDIAAHSEPALQVGGDFFDFVNLDQKPFVFTVGDVSGKGMSPALLMAMTRTVIRNSVRFMSNPLPQQVLDRTNEDLYEDFTEVSMFATVFMGHYVPETRLLTYANAGHSPVIYCPAGGPASLLAADGTAVGVLPVNLAENQQMTLNPGDMLIVATDGFSEARNQQDELFGYDRLLKLIASNAHHSAAELLQFLYDAVNSFAAGHAQDDDETIIVLKGV